MEQHLGFVLQSPQQPRGGGRGQPAVDVAADHAVERGGGQLAQRAVRDQPVERADAVHDEALGREQRRERLVQRGGLRLVELQGLRVEQADLLGAQVQVDRAQPAPGQVGGFEAGVGGGLRGKRQPAVGALPAPGARQRALVRWRQRPFVAVVALDFRQRAQQRGQPGQRQLVQAGPPGGGQRGGERHEQMHRGRIIRCPQRAGRAGGASPRRCAAATARRSRSRPAASARRARASGGRCAASP